MGIVRWCFAAMVALLVGSAYGLFTANIVLGALATVVVFLVVAYLAWETRTLGPEEREARSRRSGAGHAGVYGAGAADGGYTSGESCGFGGDGGGSFGGDGGGGC